MVAGVEVRQQPARLGGILRSKSVSSEAVKNIPIIESGDTVIVP